jgi:hypothetical protein
VPRSVDAEYFWQFGRSYRNQWQSIEIRIEIRPLVNSALATCPDGPPETSHIERSISIELHPPQARVKPQ